MAYDANTYLDPAINALRGRGGRAVGGQTWLGAAPVPQSVAPAGGTRLMPARRRSAAPLGSTITYNGGSGSMGRRPPSGVGGGGTPTFQNSDAYFRARGSGLDWLERYGPNRGSQSAPSLGSASYGGRSLPAGGTITNAAGTRARSGNSVIDFTTGQNLPATNPYTELTGDADMAVNDTSPQGRYNRMGQEQEMLAAEGLEAGRAAANQVRQLQDQAAVPTLTQTATPTGTGRSATGRYGVGSVYPMGGGPMKSFGRFDSPSPEADRQAELGEKAIANRRKAGVSEQSLLDSYYRRFGR
jgi:hypothetical protein